MTRYVLNVAAAVLIASPALAKKPDPPQPANEPDWSEVRRASEARLRERLVDPDSAKIEWDTGFRWASYKPFLQRRVFGWTGCGVVKARNRMGGYDGSAAFAIVYDAGEVKLFDIENDGSLGAVGGQCAMLKLPPPQPAFAPESVSGAGQPLIADELAKLAALRDKGVLTAVEFDAAKANLLTRN